MAFCLLIGVQLRFLHKFGERGGFDDSSLTLYESNAGRARALPWRWGRSEAFGGRQASLGFTREELTMKKLMNWDVEHDPETRTGSEVSEAEAGEICVGHQLS